MQADRTAALSDERVAFYAELAARAAEDAVQNLRSAPPIEAVAELSLAAVAERASMGEATPDELADMDEYELTDDGGYQIIDRVVTPKEAP